MQALDPNLGHLCCDRVLAVSRKPIHAGPKQEMCSQRLGCTEEFIDITLPISDVHAALWLFQQSGRLPHVLQPAVALLLLDRYARRVDPLLQLITAIELIPAPELDGRQAQWQTIERDS